MGSMIDPRRLDVLGLVAKIAGTGFARTSGAPQSR